MDLVLEPGGDAATAEAVRASAARAGVGLAPGRDRYGTSWWRAGVLAATQRAPRPRVGTLPEVASAAYDAAPPRRTRGATRA